MGIKLIEWGNSVVREVDLFGEEVERPLKPEEIEQLSRAKEARKLREALVVQAAPVMAAEAQQ